MPGDRVPKLGPSQPPHVEAVDTVGAGDAFNGALAAALADGRALRQAVPWAIAAAALAVTQPGAQSALPFREAIDQLAAEAGGLADLATVGTVGKCNGRARIIMYRRFCLMTIQLSKDMEQIVHNAVQAGLYAREEDVIRDALTRLQEAMPKHAQTPGKRAKRTEVSVHKPKKPLTIAEIHQQMLASGLISRLPDPAEDIDDDDPDDLPVPIKGEPLSETIIRERR